MSKRQTAESQCSACHARILWATNSASGRPLPLDIKPARSGQFILNELEMICTRLDLPMIERAIQNGRSLFSNHLVTCEKRKRSTSDANEEN